MLKNIKELKNKNIFLYDLILTCYKKPMLLGFPFIYKLIYSYYISFKLFGGSFFPRVYFKSSVFRVIIKKHKTSKIDTSSRLVFVFESFLHGNEATTIILEKNSVLKVEKPFLLGNGCKINVKENAELIIMGEEFFNDSGITCNSVLICSNKIIIGMGSIISWGVFICDSTQHSINGKIKKLPIIIGDKVWISEGVSIGPGSIIGSGSIIASKSYVNGEFGPKQLIAGIPASVKKRNIIWHR